jgi:hypothetical protein
MKLNRKLIRTIGGVPHINSAGILLLCAEAVHGAALVPADARVRAQRTVDEMMSAAVIGGFTKADILETMMSKDRHSDRVVDMAIDAMSYIGGPDELAAVLARSGFDPEAS